jgi:hypothetical protein
VPVRLDGLVYCIGTFTHISVRVLLLMDIQKLGVLDTSAVLQATNMLLSVKKKKKNII